MKRQANRGQQEVESWKNDNKVMLSTKRLSNQRKTSKKVNGKIYGIIQDRERSIEKCGEIKIADLYINSSSGKC